MDPSNATTLAVLHLQSNGQYVLDTSAAVDASASQAQEDGEASTVVLAKDATPDGGYGWICVACVFLINAHTWGINSV